MGDVSDPPPLEVPCRPSHVRAHGIPQDDGLEHRRPAGLGLEQVWVWMPAVGRWLPGDLRSWTRHDDGWWAAVDVPGHHAYVHEWRLRPWRPPG
jgi:hypothetical protein